MAYGDYSDAPAQDLVSEINFEGLYPALVTCFAIILTGYLSGRVNLISPTEIKGLHTFMGFFCLPSLIFVSIVNLDLSTVNMWFILAVFLSKCLVYMLILCVVILIGKPGKLGMAAILAIFATQSNDFAIGYPIMDALYKTKHPTYSSYMYLLAPCNLAILNPIGFILIELERYRTRMATTGEQVSSFMFVFRVANNIIRNPIILSTVLGVVCNFLFHHNLPSVLKNVLQVLGSAFSASALFALGMQMVGKMHTLKGMRLIVPALLILAKLLLLPIVIREMVNILNVGNTPMENKEWSTFGFLYGTLPSAPTVFVFAVQYGVEVDLVATSMVACTFVSAPWMFLSVKMITISMSQPSTYMNQLKTFMFEVSVVNLIASVWVLIIFIMTKKMSKIPHKFTACLIISQIFSSIGAIMYKYIDMSDLVQSYVQFCFFTIGNYSCRMWTAIISIALVFMEFRSLCYILFKLQPFFMLFGWGLPILLSVLLLLFDKTAISSDKTNPNFLYGDFQAIVVVSLLVMCMLVTAGCLIIHEMYRRRYESYWRVSYASQNEVERLTADEGSVARQCELAQCCTVGGNCNALPTIDESAENSPSIVTDIEDLFAGPSRGSINGSGRGDAVTRQPDQHVYCTGILQQYQDAIDEDLEIIEEEKSSHDPQVLRHIIILILLLCSMLVGTSVTIWSLVMEEMSGIYIELSFLDAALNFGQSIIIFTVFGSESKNVFLPMIKKWRALWYRTNKLVLPAESELNQDTVLVCEQFKTHHYEKCVNELATTKRFRLKTYEAVFTGKEFVEWLIGIGLARDRIDAVNYARHLVEGRVVRHINDVYHFYDKNLLYTLK